MHDFVLPEHDWQQALAAAAAAGDERPTWGYRWPAGERLAADLPAMGLCAGCRCVDLGCGRGHLGLTALAAGATAVCFADGSRHPLRYLEQVISCNELGDRATTSLHRWGEPLPGSPWQVILGGDILYRPECFAALFNTIATSLSPDGAAYLSDPRSCLEKNLPALATAAGCQLTIERVADNYSLVVLRLHP